jgi:FkbM family methyltransferase
MERQLASTKGSRLDWLERRLSAGRTVWSRAAPLYARYGLPYLFGRSNRMVVTADGARFRVRSRSFDLYILREVFERRVYEPRRSLPKPRLIVDLGANIGAFSVWAGRRWAPERIAAVEMEPENFALLQENLGANLDREVRALQAALWDRAGSVRIRRRRINKGLHEVRPDGGELVVPALTLEGALAAAGLDRVDFLKVDIEGAEARLFAPDNAAIFAERVGFVAAELHPNKGVSVAGIASWLGELGFDVAVRRQPMNRALMMEAVNRRLC